MAWRAENLPWIALGVFGSLMTYSLVTNPNNSSLMRNHYASREQCLRDYTAAQCSYNGGAGPSAYYGPYYRSSYATADDPGPGRTAAASGESTAASRVVRGGFGATARSGHGGYHGG